MDIKDLKTTITLDKESKKLIKDLIEALNQRKG